MYLFKRGLLPNYFRDMFTLASQIHSHNTRNSSLFYIPHCRNNFRKKEVCLVVICLLDPMQLVRIEDRVLSESDKWK